MHFFRPHNCKREKCAFLDRHEQTFDVILQLSTQWLNLLQLRVFIRAVKHGHFIRASMRTPTYLCCTVWHRQWVRIYRNFIDTVKNASIPWELCVCKHIDSTSFILEVKIWNVDKIFHISNYIAIVLVRRFRFGISASDSVRNYGK